MLKGCKIFIRTDCKLCNDSGSMNSSIRTVRTIIKTDPRYIDLNIEELLKVLDLSEASSIYSVMGRMQALILLFDKDPILHGLNPFLKTYYYIIRRVAEKCLENKHLFEDYKALQKLDIIFAAEFFEPLKRMLLKNGDIKPWHAYSQYSLGGGKIGFLKMLLGINAHINGDLAIALYKSGSRSRKDFLIINSILKEAIPEVIGDLVMHERDLYGAGALLVPGFTYKEFQDLIVTWRNNAWVKSLKIYPKNLPIIKREIYHEAEEISKELIRTFANPSLKQAAHFVTGLNSLKKIRV